MVYGCTHWGNTRLYWENGKENGNYRDYRDCIGLHWDNGKENGNYSMGCSIHFIHVTFFGGCRPRRAFISDMHI